jgi:hypothetical protein
MDTLEEEMTKATDMEETIIEMVRTLKLYLEEYKGRWGD